jgi:nucleoside-diphosphate-sugar epimerase
LKVGFEAFINTGSSSEYGFKDHPPKENEWIDPNSPYAVTKAAATQYCRFIAQSQKANLATVRLYSVYGPYEEPTRLIPTLIVQGLQGKLPPLVNPNISRDYVYVDDISDAYITLASNPPTTFGEVFNLGTGIQLTLKEVVEVARQHLFVNEEPSWGSMPDRQWDTSVWISDHSKITNDFKWKPINSFSGGFFKTVQWFISHTKLLTFYKDQSEVPK